MGTQRDSTGTLRQSKGVVGEAGRFATEQAAEPEAAVERRGYPAYTAELEPDEVFQHALTVVADEDDLSPQVAEIQREMIQCIAATSPRVAAAAASKDDRAAALREVIAEMDQAPFAESRNKLGFDAGAIQTQLMSYIPEWAAGQEPGTVVTGDQYLEIASRSLPHLNNTDKAQVLSDFNHQPTWFRARNLGAYAMREERMLSYTSSKNPTAAPVEYPFKTVPATRTEQTIDSMLMNDFEDSNTDSITSALQITGWGSIYLAASVRERVGQLRPELRNR